jgi:hypothetical protein
MGGLQAMAGVLIVGWPTPCLAVSLHLSSMSRDTRMQRHLEQAPH